jgi:hypothetical protein
MPVNAGELKIVSCHAPDVQEAKWGKHRHDSGVSYTGDEYDRYARISSRGHTLEDVALERAVYT